MKKRMLSVFLALALCAGLAVPAFAADASTLDASTAQAYYEVLRVYETQIYSQETKADYIAFADLRDLDGDKMPELVVILVLEQAGYLGFLGHVQVDIWRWSGGKLVKAVSRDFLDVGSVFYTAAPNGKTTVLLRDGGDDEYYHYLGPGSFTGWVARYYDYETDTMGYIRMTDFKEEARVDITKQEFDRHMEDYAVTERLMDGYDSVWHDRYDNGPTYLALLKQLAARACRPATPSPAPGAYGPYTMQGIGAEGIAYSISFSAARVEKKTIQMRTYSYAAEPDDPYSPYSARTLTVVAIRPDTRITVTGGDSGGYLYHIDPVYADGNGRYTLSYSGVPLGVCNGAGAAAFMADLTAGEAGPIGMFGDCLFVLENSGGFTDTPSWCAAAAEWAEGRKITNGTGGGRFSPSNPCTNAMILTFLWRAAGEPGSTAALPVDITGKNLAYAETALRWAAEKGMIDKTLDPAAYCTRADAVNYIWQALGKESAPASGFSDVSASAAYAPAVNWAVANGIVEGYPDGGFHPDTVCSRGVIVTMLHRAYVPSVRL